MNSTCRRPALVRLACVVLLGTAGWSRATAATLPGTRPLTMEGDLASELVTGVDRFLLRQLDESRSQRAKHWHRDPSSEADYSRSLEPNRERLRHILGLRDARVEPSPPQWLATADSSAVVAQSDRVTVYAIRWGAFGDVSGEGLLLVPRASRRADIVAIPDAGQTPEQLAGVIPGGDGGVPVALRLAESGCRVVVPVLINREERIDKLSNREYLYRSAFELGRHLLGYEIQKVLAAVDWFDSRPGDRVPIGVIGWSEGGLVALYAAALDARIQSVCVSGYFADRRNLWQEPIDRNIFGLLEQFGDAELASMVVPRKLVVEASRAAEWTLSGGRGAPARIVTPTLEEVRGEVARARALVESLPGSATHITLVESEQGHGNPGSAQALATFLSGLQVPRAQTGSRGPLAAGDYPMNAAARHERQFHELDRHNQHLLAESAKVRDQFMAELRTESLEAYASSVEPYRQVFYDEVIGRFDLPLMPPDPRSRPTLDRENWVGHEVVLDVFPDVMAYGLLLLPKDLRPNERRPVVVCQHGLEGRPQDLIGEAGYAAYKAFAAQLTERGYITFAPQNLYIFRDRFRTLQRKANPLKKTLFSVMVPQHQQIVNWLKTLPFVDPERIAFYGLSYGGKTAMRVPPLVTDYCLSICSADFNEWVDKNASTRNPHSYVFSGEYEIFEFDLGSTFNYAEMAALIAPRPFMVERGHFDGVASDETVAWEFAKVRHLYAAKLGIGDRCAIEWFVGPHTINGQGTFEFLSRHLAWPNPR